MINQIDSLQIKSHFDNFEEFSQIVQGWGLDFKQMDRGRFCANLHQIITPEVLISRVHFNRHLTQNGIQPPGMRTFGIMAEKATPFVWRKQEMMRDRLAIFPKNSELYAASIEGFHVYTISLAEYVVEEKLHQNGHPALTAKLKLGGVVEAETSKLQSLRHFLRQIFSEVTKQPELLTRQSFQKRLCDGLTSCIFDILDCSEEVCLTRPFRKHAQIVQSIESWLEETAPEYYSVNGLCRTLSVNERTLRRIVTKWYGVSPQQYLMAIRLNGVRKDLCKGFSSNTKISDIANRWGFWHMGMFADFYRKQYGELPSKTIRYTPHKGSAGQ
jgi:AraC family ethanolamine operon transcriptional activator